MITSHHHIYTTPLLHTGAGNVVPFMLSAWSEARVEVVDMSSEMLAAARVALSAQPKVSFTLADIESYTPASPVDVLFSNAAIHWVPNHHTLIPRLLHGVK